MPLSMRFAGCIVLKYPCPAAALAEYAVSINRMSDGRNIIYLLAAVMDLYDTFIYRLVFPVPKIQSALTS